MTLFATERLFWHCGAHTAEPDRPMTCCFLLARGEGVGLAGHTRGGGPAAHCHGRALRTAAVRTQCGAHPVHRARHSAGTVCGTGA